MTTNPQDGGADAFWTSFVSMTAEIERDLKTGSPDREWQPQVSRHVRQLHHELGWEVGPADHRGETLFFAFSVNGDAALLNHSESVVARAPRVAGWVFLPARPPKNWTKRCLSVNSERGRMSVDFTEWQFGLRHDSDSGLIVEFAPAPDELGLDEDETDGLAWLFLESELGEELVVRHVRGVRVCPADRGSDRLFPVRELRARITQALT